MSTTRTGQFAIGFRRLGGNGWQRDIAATIAFARENDFSCIETTADPDELRQIQSAGLDVAAVDFPDFGAGRLISTDAGERKAALEETARILRDCMEAGARTFFLVMLPKDQDKPREENFAAMVDSFQKLVPILEKGQAKIVIEGWPGRGSLVCTPETYRAFFEQVPSPAMSINYDPSHLIRMGIDPIRFVHEFAGRVGHIHGKDTEIDHNALYQFGHEVPPTFAKAPGWGTCVWRYTLPGYGQMRWTRALEILRDAGYKGKIGIELEDYRFNGIEAGERLGFIKSREYLEGC